LTLIRGLEEQLHAEAYAEHRLSQRGNQLIQTGAAQPHHGVRGGAHSRENDVRRITDDAGLGRHPRSHVQALERELQRGDVGAAAGDDNDLRPAHSVPLVLGSSLPSMRMAWRRLRPTPLKHASTM
jgi:hypothetical protein